MEAYIFARFHAHPGQEQAVDAAIREVILPTREEPGCLSIHAYRSTQDPQLFYIYSRWTNQAAFDNHVGLPHTVHFLERTDTLTDRPREVTRAEMFI